MIYEYGGFGLPFYVVGSVTIVVAVALMILIPKGTKKSEKEVRPALNTITYIIGMYLKVSP